MAFVASGSSRSLALFAIFAFAPVGIVLWLSLHRYNQLAPTAPSSAARNYEFAFTQDPYFTNALIVTLKYALVAVLFNLIIALPIAIGLNQVTRLRAVFRSAFFLPTVASAVAVSLDLELHVRAAGGRGERFAGGLACLNRPGWLIPSSRSGRF